MNAFVVVEYDKRDSFDQALPYVLADATRALRRDYGMPDDDED